MDVIKTHIQDTHDSDTGDCYVKYKFNETENSFKKYCSLNPVDLAMDQKFIIEKLASNGWNKETVWLSLKSSNRFNRSGNSLTPHRHILVIGKASQGKQFNSRIAALCAGFEEHVLALNSNIDGVEKESHVIDAFQRVWTKAVVNSCKVCLIINYKSCSKLMRPVQNLIWKITNVLATGKHDFEIFSGDEAKLCLDGTRTLRTLVSFKL